jgi:hypothetical protein
MSSDAGSPFTVDRLSNVSRQIRAAALDADAGGFKTEYLTALKVSLEQLAHNPLGWGEPRYNTRHKGGVVCQRIYRMLNLHYAVYQEERKVLILDLKLLAPPREQPPPST